MPALIVGGTLWRRGFSQSSSGAYDVTAVNGGSPMKTTERCSAPDCERPAEAVLEARYLCRDHYLTACYQRLEECAQRLHEQAYSDTAAEAVRQFLEECMRQATEISQSAENLDNLARARLLDILLWSADLVGRLRRGPRRAISLPIRLFSEKPGYPWQEESKTVVLSQHGALVNCHHVAEPGDALRVYRLDTGREAEARVVWCRAQGHSEFQIGLELVGTDNFWNLDWSTVERQYEQ